MRILWCAMIVAGLTLSFGCASRAPVEQPQVESRPMPIEDAFALIDLRAGWEHLPPINIPRHPAEKFLKDMTIVLDPGHGGDAHRAGYKRGPTGEREAEMNLRVGLLLARLLKDAGANVILTRDSDVDLELHERAAIANNAVRPDGGMGADLFISLHHNASSSREANFSSVWYHGQVNENEIELDVARYIAHALGRNMRTQVAKTSPLLSSHLMYETGFGVLRTCRVPAILLESSFYTNPAEEQRLRDAEYNLREAYAIYEGLCEWAYCGRPTQSQPEITISGSHVQVRTRLTHGLPNWWGAQYTRIVRSTVRVTLDRQALSHDFDENRNLLTATLPAGAGEYILSVHHANMFKNHNWPQRYRIVLDDGADGLTASVEQLGAQRTRRPRTGE